MDVQHCFVQILKLFCNSQFNWSWKPEQATDLS